MLRAFHVCIDHATWPFSARKCDFSVSFLIWFDSEQTLETCFFSRLNCSFGRSLHGPIHFMKSCAGTITMVSQWYLIWPQENHLSMFHPFKKPSFPTKHPDSFEPPFCKARALQGLGRGGGFFERSVVEVDRTEVGHLGCRVDLPVVGGEPHPLRGGFCINQGMYT